MIAYPPPENRQVSDVWSSLGGDLKPSVDLVITIALQPDTLYEVAQAVMAPLRLRAVGHTTYDVEDDVRQLRQPLAGEPGPAETGAAEPVPVAAVGAKPSKSPRAKGP
jgi:hypothetical protein